MNERKFTVSVSNWIFFTICDNKNEKQMYEVAISSFILFQPALRILQTTIDCNVERFCLFYADFKTIVLPYLAGRSTWYAFMWSLLFPQESEYYMISELATREKRQVVSNITEKQGSCYLSSMISEWAMIGKWSKDQMGERMPHPRIKFRYSPYWDNRTPQLI